MMAVGFAFYMMYEAIVHHGRYFNLMAVVSLLGMFNNLLPNPSAMIEVGPYWYIGLTMQLYVVYRFLLYPGRNSLSCFLPRHLSWILLVSIIVICTIWQYMYDPESRDLIWLRYNWIGSILPFGAGILYARYVTDLHCPKLLIASICAVSGVLILWFSGWYATWYLVPIIVCVCAITFVKLIPGFAFNMLKWIGVLSSSLFVCHPITRNMFYHMTQYNIWTALILYMLSSIVMALCFKHLFDNIRLVSRS